MLDLPAFVAGKTAIFYSGSYDNIDNEVWAEKVRDLQLQGAGYLVKDTPAGAFVNGISPGLEVIGIATPGTKNALWRVASAMMGDQARGSVIACVSGGEPITNSVWQQFEIPALIANAGKLGPSEVLINSIAVSELVGVPSPNITALAGKLSQCYLEPEEVPVLSLVPQPQRTWDAAVDTATDLLIGAGAIAAGTAAYLWLSATDELSTPAVIAGLGLLNTGRVAPVAPTVVNAATAYMYRSQLAAYAATGLAADLAYMSLASGAAAGELPASLLTSVGVSQRRLDSLSQFLANNPNQSFSIGADGPNRPAIQVAASESGLITAWSNTATGKISTDFDVGNSQAWFASANTFNTSGSITTSEVLLKTGARESTTYDATDDYDWSFSKATIVDGVSVEVTRGLDSGVEIEAVYGSDGRDEAGGGEGNDTLIVEGWDPEVHHASSGGGITPPPLPAAITLSEVGTIFGSTLGNYLAGDNTFAKVAAGSALAAVLSTAGRSFDRYFGLDGAAPAANFETAIEQGFSQFGANLFQAVQAQSLGAISNFLTAELADALGIDHTVEGALVQNVGNALINRAVANVASTGNPLNVFAGFGEDAFNLPVVLSDGTQLASGAAFNVGHIGCMGLCAANDNPSPRMRLAA